MKLTTNESKRFKPAEEKAKKVPRIKRDDDRSVIFPVIPRQKTVAGMIIYHFRDVGYWVAPCGVTVRYYYTKKEQSVIFTVRWGRYKEEIKLHDHEYCQENLLATLEEVLDAVQRIVGFYSLLQPRYHEDIVVYTREDNRVRLGCPTILRSFYPELPRETKRAAEDDADFEQKVVAMKALRDKWQGMLDKIKTCTRGSALIIHNELPLHYIGYNRS